MLVGSNTEETRLFLLSDGSIDRITKETPLRDDRRLWSAGRAGPEHVPRGASEGSIGELFSDIQTDWY